MEARRRKMEKRVDGREDIVQYVVLRVCGREERKRRCASGSVVEYRLAKARVAGSNPVSCSLKSLNLLGFFYFVLYFMLHDILKVVVYHIVYFFSFLRKCLHVYFFHHII